jgi:hypothetical protein
MIINNVGGKGRGLLEVITPACLKATAEGHEKSVTKPVSRTRIEPGT